MSPKMALRRFTLRAAGGFRGRDGGKEFAGELISCFGTNSEDAGEEGPVLSHSFAVVDGGKRSTRSVSAYWPARRVVVDVVDRDLMLDLAWSDLLRACLQMETAPQYVVITNQRDVRLYDLSRARSEPRLSIALDELPKYSEAFPFFEPDWVPGTTPKIINVDKVSKEVAGLVAKVYRALDTKNPDREDDVIRFTLRCIVAMFAEDIGLLPKEYFTTLLYRAAEEGDAGDKLGELFRAMSSNKKNDSGIPFFNGGLFRNPATLKLGEAPLRALTKAAESNWTFVDPHIFGSVFQGIMDDAERHASGAHYTAREDIMNVVGPTIVEPWRERITAAATLKDLRQILRDLHKFRVLDPACGSGNFLYVAFRELYRLETEALTRVYEYTSSRKGRSRLGWTSGILTTNFFGFDINPFAVELAKTTLNIAKKIAFEERKATVLELFAQGFLEVDPSLPLDNLDENIFCTDALFAEWPTAHAIVGNPPFLGGKKLQDELGSEYVGRLHVAYPNVHGRSDYCAYWFLRAHDALSADGRAGLIGTSSIRHGITAAASLRYIVENGGSIVYAVSERDWPGEAAVTVSIVNWTNGTPPGRRTLVVGGKGFVRDHISSHLELRSDTSEATPLFANRFGTSQGVDFSTTSYYLGGEVAARLFRDPTSTSCVFGLATGESVLSGRVKSEPAWVVYLPSSSATEARKAAAAYEYLERHVYPEVAKTAERKSYSSWLRTWWRPWRAQKKFFDRCLEFDRLIGCSQTQARPIFFFLSTAYRPTNAIQLFAFDDDYTFGILQSSLHWAWARANGGRMGDRIRYRTKVWKTFPWPQEPSEEEVASVADAARALRSTREGLMAQNGWSLRALYQSADVAGSHPLKDALHALDAAVERAYGKPEDQEATEFLLELNLALAEDEAAGHQIQGAGLPSGLRSEYPRWYSTDCIEPPPFEIDDDAERAHG